MALDLESMEIFAVLARAYGKLGTMLCGVKLAGNFSNCPAGSNLLLEVRQVSEGNRGRVGETERVECSGAVFFSNEGWSGMGDIIRNEIGDVMAAISHQFMMQYPPAMLEALAVTYMMQ